MAFTGNIGEWSEAYTLFKVLADKNLYIGDENLEKISGLMHPVIKVLRSEADGNFEYAIDSDLVIVSSNGHEICRISVDTFKQYAELTLTLLKQKKIASTSTKSAFELPEIEGFLNQLNCKSLKASSSAKTDITIVIHDVKTNQKPYLGYSIKSQLGSASTLLNPGKTTNFVFTLEGGMTDAEMVAINAIDSRRKIKERMNQIMDLGYKLKFQNILNPMFSNNLTLIDSQMPEIVSQLLACFYCSSESSIATIVDTLEKENPLKFDTANSHKFYTYKIKRLLTDIAVGLMPSKKWNGVYDTTGGYLIVKDTGDILCYYLYDRNQFEDYLFNNTKLDTASTSRFDFGNIYKVEDKYYIKLNLQIRFNR